jgi:hypothetical protein
MVQRNGHAANGKAATVRVPVAKVPAPLEPLKPGSNGQAEVGTVRQANGQYGPGNRSGHGNPFHRTLAAIRKVAVETVGAEGVKKVMAKLLAQALEGDVLAARVVLLYCVGKPAAAVDPDGVDLDEWKRLERSPTAASYSRALLDCVPAEWAAELLRTLLLARHGQKVREVCDDVSAAALEAERAARVGR